jgi:acyl-CoA synthetase (AMP-forming)/AMP-acid ligase II
MAGNGMRPDVWERFQERFGITKLLEFFNSSEAIFTTINGCEGDYLKNAVGHHGLLLRFSLRNASVPVEFDWETQSIVRDPVTGFARRKSYEDGGEILVKVSSEAAFQGYCNSQEATSKKFERDVFRKGDIYFRTGDTLKRTKDGRWFFLDRLGDTFRWKGEKVSTAEVEEVLGSFPGILEANVYGVLVPSTEGRAGSAAIAIAPEQLNTFDWVSSAKFLRSKLPTYAVPIFLQVMAAEIGIMGSHNNKQIKGALREEGINPSMKGTKVEGGKRDQVRWISPERQTYIEFKDEDWSNLNRGKARF